MFRRKHDKVLLNPIEHNKINSHKRRQLMVPHTINSFDSTQHKIPSSDKSSALAEEAVGDIPQKNGRHTSAYEFTKVIIPFTI